MPLCKCIRKYVWQSGRKFYIFQSFKTVIVTHKSRCKWLFRYRYSGSRISTEMSCKERKGLYLRSYQQFYLMYSERAFKRNERAKHSVYPTWCIVHLTYFVEIVTRWLLYIYIRIHIFTIHTHENIYIYSKSQGVRWSLPITSATPFAITSVYLSVVI